MNRQKIIIISALAVLLLAGGIFALTANNNSTNPSNGSDVSDQNTNDNQDEESSADDQTPTEQESQPNPQNDPKAPIETPKVMDVRNVTIVRTNVDSGTLTVSAIVENALLSDSCTLIMSKSGQADQKFTVKVVQQPSYIACKNFSVSTSSLPSSGQWSIKVIINGNAANGESDVQTVTI